MKQVKNRTVLWLAVGAVVLAGVFSAGDAHARDGLITEPVIRGEQARLLRQAYDYLHRNSNDNVYRNSRHHHPTRNVFRSSRHYKRRVAASSDGYPLRTFIRFGRSVDGGPRKQIEYSFAHHRRQPFGLPSVEEPGLEALLLGGGHGRGARRHDGGVYRSAARSRWRHHGNHHDRAVCDAAMDEPPLRARPQYRVITPAGTVTNADDASGGDETERDVVIRTVQQPDGTVRTVITNASESNPKPQQDPAATLDDAWSVLGDGQYKRSMTLFNTHFMDEARGAEAMVGYGIAAALAGDVDSARTAFERAQKIDERVLENVRLSGAVRDALHTTAEEVDDAAVSAVLEQLAR